MYSSYKILKRVLEHKELVKAAQFEKPLLLFHGTSSKFLRSILKQGLIAHSKEGRWVGEDEGVSELTRSRVSYGGVYLTTSLQTATSAATNLISNSEPYNNRVSNPIVVCTLVQPSTTIGDEDDYKFNIFNGGHIPESMIPNVLTVLRAKPSLNNGYGNKEWGERAHRYISSNVDYLLRTYAPSYDIRQDKSKLYPIAQEVVLTELERQIAYKSVRGGVKPYYSYDRDARRTLDSFNSRKGGWAYDKPLPQKMRPESKEKAEQRAKQALDLFIKMTKTYSKKNLEEQRDSTYTKATTRVIDSITYSGKNRITCIVELIQSKTEKYGSDIVLHYGTIPAEFKRQYVQSKGPWPKVFDKSGEQQVESADEQVESSLGEVYHSTSIFSLYDILSTKSFKLSTSLGTRSDKTNNKYPYFLSLTRSKIGGYHSRSPGNYQALVALDADYLKHNHKMGPIDYWGREYRAVNQNMNEMEEKLVSKDQLLKFDPTKLIHSIHLLIKPDKNNSNWNHNLRRTLLLCKLMKIPTFVYNNDKDWLSQRPQKAVPLNSYIDQMKGQEPEREPQWPRTNFIEPWVELYNRPFEQKAQLSKRAKSMMRYVESEYRIQEGVTSLEADIHSNRSSPNIAPLVKILSKVGSIKKFLYLLHNKWYPDDLIKVESEDFDRSERDKLKGKPLQTTNSVVVIYRACQSNSPSIGKNDYVTLTLNFAKEHAVSNSIVNGEKYHVLKAVARSKHVFEAMNPGKYFYDGPALRCRSVFEADEDGEEIESSLSNMSLEEFIKSDLRNGYVRYKTLKSYFRKGQVRVDRNIYKEVLTRASTTNSRRASNVEHKDKHKSTGLYREFDDLTKKLAKQYGFEGVYVESVLNQFLGKKLESYGYVKCNEDYGVDNYFYKIDQDKVEAALTNDEGILCNSDGTPMVFYHQTSQENAALIKQNGFDLNKIGARGSDTDLPDGIYFKNNPNNISVGTTGTPAQMPYNLKLKNPLYVADREALLAILRKNTKFDRAWKRADLLDRQMAKKIYDLGALAFRVRKPLPGSVEHNAQIDLDKFMKKADDKRIDQISAQACRKIGTQILKDSGYDGVIVLRDVGSFNRVVSTTIIFDPKQAIPLKEN